MDVLPLLLPFFVVPGIDALPPADLYVDGDLFAFDQELGTGRTAGAGEVAVVHYVLSQEGGKELANTTLRGLPYSVLVDGTVDVLPIAGMRVGGTRVVNLPSSRLATDGSLLPKDSTLVLLIRLVRVETASVRSRAELSDRRKWSVVASPPVHHPPTASFAFFASPLRSLRETTKLPFEPRSSRSFTK